MTCHAVSAHIVGAAMLRWPGFASGLCSSSGGVLITFDLLVIGQVSNDVVQSPLVFMWSAYGMQD